MEMTCRPNVLLIVPRYFSTEKYGYIMPMGMLYVSAALKQSGVANVFTLNLNHENPDYESVVRRMIEVNKIDMIGCGGISGQFIEIYPLFKAIRKIAPDVRIITGGGMITADAETAMRAFGDTVDVGIIGEGEITLPDLISALANGGDLASIPGLIYPDGKGGFVTTSRRRDIDNLDSLPLPDYLSFDYDKYLQTNGEWEGNTKFSPVAIIGGRSCKYNCTFCFHPTGSKYRQRSLDSIFHEIDFLLDHFTVNYIALREELFASDEQRVLDFCRRIKDYPIVWSIQLRVDSVSQTIVDALRNSNCRYIFLGIESADNRILKSMRKQISIEQVEDALEMCINAGLCTRSTIILGDEAETLESADRTLQWWLKHKKRSAIDLGLIIAFPGSTLYKHALANNRIPDPVQFLFDGCPVTNLSKNYDFNAFKSIADRISGYSGIRFTLKDYTHENTPADNPSESGV